MNVHFAPCAHLLCTICKEVLVNEGGEVLKPFYLTNWGIICTEDLKKEGSRLRILDKYEYRVGDRIARSDRLFKPSELIETKKMKKR